MEPIYFKITNEKENHNGFQYRDGLNILLEEFNNNPKASCVAGGFYFTTKKYIHNFYKYGCYLRVIELPETDPTFKMVKDPSGDKIRSNKIILKEKYLLSDPKTYQLFGLEYPKLSHCVKEGYLDIIKILFETGINIHEYDDIALRVSAENGYLNVVQYLVEKGANIHSHHEHALRLSAERGHLDVVRYLVEKGANIHAINDYALRLSARNGHLDVVQYLVEKGANIDADNDYALRLSAENGYSNVMQYLVKKRANMYAKNDYALRLSAKNGDLEIVQYLIEKGANIRADNDKS